jgi:hypothetical protein
MELYILIVFGVVLIAFADTVSSPGTSYELNYQDIEFNEMANTLDLTRELLREYPELQGREIRLSGITLKAKSYTGRGRVSLKLGSNPGIEDWVEGSPADFNSSANHTFHLVRLKNDHKESPQPWIVSLDGRFRLREIEVMVDFVSAGSGADPFPIPTQPLKWERIETFQLYKWPGGHHSKSINRPIRGIKLVGRGDEGTGSEISKVRLTLEGDQSIDAVNLEGRIGHDESKIETFRRPKNVRKLQFHAVADGDNHHPKLEAYISE